VLLAQSANPSSVVSPLIHAEAQVGFQAQASSVLPGPATSNPVAPQTDATANQTLSLSALASAIRDAGLDPDECYRVRDLDLTREDVRIYLTEGFLIFGKPVVGKRISAVFVGEIDGGDAEVLLFPPLRSERMSLAKFTESPNLNEHFKLAAFLFTDDTHQEVLERIRSGEVGKRVPEMGSLYVERYTSLVKNLSESVEARLVKDLSDPAGGSSFFLASIRGLRLGSFDMIVDAAIRKGVRVGQFSLKENRPYFDMWTQFDPRSIAGGKKQPAGDEYRVQHYDMDATLEAGLTLKVNTRIRLQLSGARRTIAMLLAQGMEITSAKVGGEAVEYYRPPSMRLNSYRSDGDAVFLLRLPPTVQPRQVIEVDVAHQGQVIQDAGNGVYLVGSRGSWYPGGGPAEATYNLDFRLPANLQFAATSDVITRREDGDMALYHVEVKEPVRTFGFNIGRYKSVAEQRNGFTIHVHANQQVETALEPRPQVVVTPPAGPQNRRHQGPTQISTITPNRLDPTRRLQDLGKEVAELMEKLSERFGPPPLQHLHVSPIPGHFGQGFAGMVYLSTISYLPEADRPAFARQPANQVFFNDLLLAHEVAHQWWGNLVFAATEQDEWLMEGLATYTSLMILEEQKGQRAAADVLRSYRDRLVTDQGDERTLESAGPIIWGPRLVNSKDQNAWAIIMYEKGAWIFHMLREQMGNEAFARMLRELPKRFERQGISTEDFRLFAAAYMPPKSEDPKLEEFFAQWVESTGIPKLSLQSTILRRAPKPRVRVKLLQSMVGDEFAVHVPIQIRYAQGKTERRFLLSSNDGEEAEWDLSAMPTKIELDPDSTLLRRD